MATRPAFQFYPADWRNNANLRRCSEAARGAWIDVLCLLHDSDEYGVLRWPLADIAQAAGLPIKLLQELVRKSVLKGAERDAAPYVFTPSHAGKAGDPVTLVAAGSGPCWYCSRFVRDEYVRQRRGANTRFSPDNPPPKAAPKGGIGDNKGYGASSSSSTTSTKQEQKQKKRASAPTRPEGVSEQVWNDWLALRRAKSAPVTPTVLAGATSEAAKAGMSLEAFLTIWCRRGSQGLEADWLKPNERAGPQQAKPSAAADFRGKTYESTPIDQLPPDLRAAAERAMRDD